jgi:hypothetical protein
MNRFTLQAARAGFLAAGLFCLSAVGCSTDEIENRITCADVCNRYQECIDDDYDVSACVDRCEDDATANEEKERRLEACEACIDDESCASAVFECTTECAQFVP